ncbi:MAG: ATP-binding protein, partial [Armatimonadetes bacterium]|nr:ATP-binding protein [Armatimonadota bacterium]
TGPRQVGKTHLLLEIARELGDGATYLAADAPDAAIPGWWELQLREALLRSEAGPVALLVDEVQYLPRWERLLKAAYDELRRIGARVHLVLTGSAALGVGAGVQETMAGRFERLELCHWSPRDMATAFGLSQPEACEGYVRLGSFPGAVALIEDLPRWRAYLRDAIISPALGRDLLLLEQVRRPALLRQVFAVASCHPAHILSLNKLAGTLQDSGAIETIAHYLDLLERAYLVAPVRKWSAQELRRRASPPKLVALSNAFLAALRQSDPPTATSDPAEWGVWLENACVSFAISSGQTVHYWREEPHEVDAVIEGTWGWWALEVKGGRFTRHELRGLLEFVRRNPEFRPAIVCDQAELPTARALGIPALDWRDYLWDGLAGAGV